MGPKWLEALSRAVTYAGSGITVLAGGVQAAQQQEQLDAACTALFNSPEPAIISETPSGSQDTPTDFLQNYLDQVGIIAPLPGEKNPKQSAPFSAPQAALTQGVENITPFNNKSVETPMNQAAKPWEIDLPVATLYGTIQDAGDGLTGGSIAEAQEKAKKTDKIIHSKPLYGEYSDLPSLTNAENQVTVPPFPPSTGTQLPATPPPPSAGKALAIPPPADGMPPKMLSGNQMDHFQGTYTLKPNQTYTVNGATYHTDGNGAIQSWSVTLSGSRQAAHRSSSHQKYLPGKLEGDHAGHYVAASEGGSGLADNLAAMDAKVNTRDYRAFERENHNLLKDGYTVHLEGSSHMGSSALRPDAIMVTRTVYDSDGNLRDREHFSWTNTDMSQYQKNDFGDRDIPNAMDESLAKAGITREEITALEDTACGVKPDKHNKQAKSTRQDQAREDQREHALPTDDQREKAGTQDNPKEVAENEYGQPESQGKKVPEEANEILQQDMDVAREVLMSVQEEKHMRQPGGLATDGKNITVTQKPEAEQNVINKEHMQAGIGKSENSNSASETPIQRTYAAQKNLPLEDHREATSHSDAWEKKSESQQTDSQKAANDRVPQPWEKNAKPEAEQSKTADVSQEPWRRNEPAQNSRATSEVSRDEQQPNGTGQTPQTKDSSQSTRTDDEMQEMTDSQTGNSDKGSAQKDRRQETESSREPWKREDSAQEKPGPEPSSQSDALTRDNDGGYHY